MDKLAAEANHGIHQKHWKPEEEDLLLTDRCTVRYRLAIVGYRNISAMNTKSADALELI